MVRRFVGWVWLFLLVMLFVGGDVFASEMKIDDRFGLGGNCGIAKDLGVAWSYNWGGGEDYPNQDEESCVNTYGRKVFYTLGTGTQFDFSYLDKLSDLEDKYLITEQERGDYEKLKGLLAELRSKKLTYGLPAQLGYLLIPKYVEDNPSGYFQIDNEPDLWKGVGDQLWSMISPEEYAEYYHLYSKRIKKYDPTAKVMVGGLVNWLPETAYNNNDRYAWMREFREAHKVKYGKYPVVDVWSVHLYIWKTADWQVARSRLEGLRNFLVDIGEGDKPIWLTEFSVGGKEGDLVLGHPCDTHGCLSDEQQRKEYLEMTDSFMIPLVNWLRGVGYVERWFWFYGGAEYQWEGLNGIGNIYKNPDSDGYNLLGVTYGRLLGGWSGLIGDGDGNGKVDIFDYNLLVEDFGKQGRFLSDWNSNGWIDIFDYNLFIENYGKVKQGEYK